MEDQLLEARHCLVLLDVIAPLPFLGLKTSESVKISPFIELTSELEGEQDLVLGGRGVKGGGLVGNVLGLGVIEMDKVGSLIISNSLS